MPKQKLKLSLFFILFTFILICPTVRAEAPPAPAETATEKEAPAKKTQAIKPKINLPIPTLKGFSDVEIEEGKTADIPWLAEYIVAIYQYAIIIGSIIAVLTLLAGGILFLTAGGLPSNVGKAKKMMVGSITGLVILMSSYLILYIVNPKLVDLKATKVESVPVEFLDESTDGMFDEKYIPGSTVKVPDQITPGKFGKLNTAGTCTASEVIKNAKWLANQKLCQGACHCAATAFRILFMSGCDVPPTGGATLGKSKLKKSGWITQDCKDFDIKKIPVGYLWTKGHAMISIGGGQLVESSTDITKCWKDQSAVKECKKVSKYKFDSCAISHNECPKSTDLSKGKNYCDYCAYVASENPSTCRFSGTPGCGGTTVCASNQCTYVSGISRLKKIYSKCTITYKPGWENSGNVTHSGNITDSKESIDSSGH